MQTMRASVSIVFFAHRLLRLLHVRLFVSPESSVVTNKLVFIFHPAVLKVLDELDGLAIWEGLSDFR